MVRRIVTSRSGRCFWKERVFELLNLAEFARILYSFKVSNTFWQNTCCGLTYIVRKRLDKRALQAYLYNVVFS